MRERAPGILVPPSPVHSVPNTRLPLRRLPSQVGWLPSALVAVGFGGGMGRLRQNCGAYSAMVMVCGALSGADGASSQRREEVYARVQQVERLFRETFGTTQCAELLRIPPKAQPPKPAERTTAYYDSRPCAAIVAGAARLLEELMLQTQEEQGCAR